MLWLIVIMLIGALSFVIFHKPHVNAMGAGWVPPEKRKLEAQRQLPASGETSTEETSTEDSVTAPVAKAPATPDTFNFNDIFGGPKNQGPTDRPSA